MKHFIIYYEQITVNLLTINPINILHSLFVALIGYTYCNDVA